MNKEKFYSELFRREIHKSEPEYKQKAIAEALFRVHQLVESGVFLYEMSAGPG